MAMAKKNQCIHCSVESCQHHELSGLCALSDIQVAPKEKCCSGKADESQCSSYKCRWFLPAGACVRCGLPSFPEESMTDAIPASIARARHALDARLGRPVNSDMKRRDLLIFRREASVYYADGLVSTEFLQRFVLTPLGETAETHFEGDLPAHLTALVPIGDASAADTLQDAVSAVVAGKAVVVSDGMAAAVSFDVRGFVRRSVSPPLTESVVMGPHQAFNETLRDNVTLLRRILPTPLLVGEMISLGDVIPVTACVMSLSDRVDEDTLRRVKGRLAGIRRDTLLSVGEVEQLIEDSPWAILPQCCLTERPDRAASFLLEGQVVVLLDGSPQALAAPVSLWHLMHTPDDTGMRFPYAVMTRLIRFLGALLTLLLPGLFVPSRCIIRRRCPSRS